MSLTIDSGLAGTKLKGLAHNVSWRETTNYAAAVSDVNPRYLDDTCEEGLVAPPLFAVALTWPIMTEINEQLPDPPPPEAIMTMVHASEHIIFHRPVRPGDRLRLGGQVAAVLSTRAGTHLVLQVEATDQRDQPVFTEYAGALFRGVPCSAEDAGRENLPVLPVWGENKEPIWEREIDVSPEMPFIYDGCSDIVFPIHTSVGFARQVGLPGIILQGTATLALAARELLNHLGDGVPERLREIGCRFSGMVLPDSAIRLQLTERRDEKQGLTGGFRVLNGEGKTALSAGFALIQQ